MYIAGRLRTASRSPNTLMLVASYCWLSRDPVGTGPPSRPTLDFVTRFLTSQLNLTGPSSSSAQPMCLPFSWVWTLVRAGHPQGLPLHDRAEIPLGGTGRSVKPASASPHSDTCRTHRQAGEVAPRSARPSIPDTPYPRRPARLGNPAGTG